MKIAIISITKNGKILAMDIYKALKDDSTTIKLDIYHKNVNQTLKNIFNSYDYIIGIMASGIMVRSICSLIKSKEDDPAVLIIDEKGKHVISLLSGHLGGGNDFTIKIANILKAVPVITTATDINNKFGVDCFAKKYYLKIDDISKIKIINSTLIQNEKVNLSLSPNFMYLWEDMDIKNSYNKSITKSNFLTVSNGLITLNLKPKKIVVGIGSKKNIKSESVINAIKSALKVLNLPINRINSIATGYMKKNEKGIILAAEKFDLPLEIIPDKLLKNFTNKDISTSEFVVEKFGIPGVCEPTSLIAAGEDSTLIFRKTIYNGVTVAVAVSKN
jgi:cobalt-precorrin 5A hydrolase